MQDKSVVSIGRIMGNVSAKKYENYIQNMFPGSEYKMLSIDFNISNNSCNYIGIDTHTITNNYIQYGYRKGSARGGDITFTTKAGDISKKFKTFLKQLTNFIKVAQNQNYQDDVRVFRLIEACINEKQADIVLQLTNTLEAFDKKEQQKCGFTLLINDNGQEKNLTDFPTTQHLLIKNGTAGKSEKYSVRSEGKNKTCCICLEEKPLVHGFASPYKFSTVDKPGMVSGFFKQANNWKNYPICSDCAFDFEKGRDHISQHLQQTFYGKRYFIIPQAILATDDKIIKKVIKTIQDIDYQATKDGKASITSRENYLMRFIGKSFGSENDDETTNKFTLNLLFYEENPTTKAMKIKLALEEILPSIFFKLFIKIPQEINGHPVYQNVVYNKKEWRDLTFTFGVLKDFFEDDFYQIVQTVFMGISISQDLLFSRFMRRIRGEYNKKQSSDGYVEWGLLTVAKSHLVLSYFHALGIISLPKKIDAMQEEQKGNEDFEINPNQKKKPFAKDVFDQFIVENQSFLKSDLHKGIFAVGILVRFLFNLQSANLEGSTPFEKKLHGYNLDENRLKKIYRESLEKISQYTSFFSYLELREIINDNFCVNVADLQKLSNDELSFYFVAGLEMGNKFKNKTNKINN